MILNIRGTSGSGKTHLGRQLVHHYKGTEITADGHIFGYRLPNNLWVLGRYDDAIKGGGVDNITGRLHKRFLEHGGEGNTMDAVDTQVRKWAAAGHHVMFEGLIVTSIWSRWVRLAADFPMTFLFLDTPLEVCYQRVLKRSGGRTPKGYPGNSDMEGKHAQELKRIGELRQKESSMEDFYQRQSKRYIPKAEADGLRFQILNYEEAFDQLVEIVEGLDG